MTVQWKVSLAQLSSPQLLLAKHPLSLLEASKKRHRIYQPPTLLITGHNFACVFKEKLFTDQLLVQYRRFKRI